MDAASATPHRPQRGPGVLVVDLSTMRASDEGYWAGIEGHTEGSTLLVRASFGPGSVFAVARWMMQRCGFDERRRLATLHLPYFNLADGSKSTEASLVVEVILSQGLGQRHLPPIGSEGQTRSFPEAAGDLGMNHDSRSSRILAVGGLDVQTTLLTGGRNRIVLETSGTTVVHLTVRKGLPFISPASPRSAAVRVGLAFSKAPAEERIKRERRGPGCVPTFFVVATTLFDCATLIKEAELRLYARCAHTGDVSLLSSDERGAIVVHESFEWNSSADVSTLFTADPIGASARVRPGAVIVALLDKSVKAARNSVKLSGAQEVENAIGMLKLSCEDLEACGSEGRWYSLRASLGTTELSHRSHFDLAKCGSKSGGIVGEALVSFSWLQYPAAAVLPRAPSARRLAQTRTRKKRKLEDKNLSDGKHCADGRNDRNDADVDTAPQPRKCCGENALLPQLLVYIHVWDALIPLGRPDSAVYVTTRVYCPGSRGQRVSTRPVRGRRGLSAAEAASKDWRPDEVCPSANSRSEAMHVVWDEHLKISVDGDVEGMLIELLLSDAAIDHGKTATAVLAAREGEDFDRFSECNRLGGLGDMAKSFTSARIPRPTVYRLKLLHVDGSDAENGQVDIESAERGNILGGVDVRMASLVVLPAEAASRADEVKAFLERKADIARIPDELNRSPLAVGDVAGLASALSRRSLRKASRPRLLDLSAVGGLFRRFADAERGRNEAEEAGYTGDAASKEGRISSMVSEVGATEQHPAFEATISKKNFVAAAKEYFPGIGQSVHNDDTLTFPQTTENWATMQDGSAPSLSFADFVSWLRHVPEEALGVAGLLATPRTVLHNTEIVMYQSTEQSEELAAMLRLAEVPTTGLVGGWCSVSLGSTREGAALDRVRLGWGEATEEKKESSWRRHLRMLGHDVTVLGDALAQLEERCFSAQSRDSANAHRTAVGERDVNIPEELARGVESEPPAQDSRVDESGIQHVGEKSAVIACGNSVGGRKEDPANFVVTRYLDQEAKKLGVASAHLKEALRCAGDSLYRDVDKTPPGWSTKPYGTRGRRGHTQSPAASRRDPCDSYLYRHHLYGTVLQHIKHVQCFQFEIKVLRRRIGALLPPSPGEETMQLVDSQRCSHSLNGIEGSFGREAPRSALALVKRIRRAQEAARHPPAFTDIEGTTMQPVAHQPREQGGDCSPASKSLCHHPSSGYVNVVRVVRDEKGVVRDEKGSLTPWETPFYHHQGGALTESTFLTRVSAQPSLYGLSSPRRTSLGQVRRRLETVRDVFRGKSVELPAAVVCATAELLADIAGGRGNDENGASLANAWPAAAMCCPIDRFTLHVFRTAGAAENGGTTVFTDVQELAAMGGLDTHASEHSLWVTAARAGIVDVDRWVVAAVLWQAADAVEAASGYTDQIRPPGNKSTGAAASEETNKESNGTALERVTPGKGCVADLVLQGGASCEFAERKHIGKGIRPRGDINGAASTNELALISAEATSLWEELCREAFRSAFDNRSVHQTRSSEDSSTMSAFPSSSHREGQHDIFPFHANSGAVETAVSTGDDLLRQRYSASASISSSFDHALIRTLAVAGRCASGAVAGTVVTSTTVTTPGVGSSTAVSMVETSARSTRVEEILIYTYAIAGFVDGSGLELGDIVEAVKVRRQRAAIGRRTVEPSLRGTDDGSTGPESAPPLEQTQTLPETRGSNELFSRQRGAVYGPDARTTGGNGDGISADSASRGTETQLVGIPPELWELFRAAAFADIARKQQQQQQQQQHTREEGADQVKLEAADLAVIRVLDSNRTLESAAFSGGRTALHHAAVRGDHALVRLLLERGCKPHTKDFDGKRACDLTRDLKCLCLLGALKKSSPPSALSLRTSETGVPRGKGGHTPPQQGQARAMISIEFAVSFRKGASTHTSDGGNFCTTSMPKLENAEWAEGIARWYDVRNKVMYIDDIERDNNSGDSETAAAIAPAQRVQDSAGNDQRVGRAEQGPFPRHVLDVRLTSCISPRGAYLFDQLKAFAREWKEALVADMLHLAIEAAADLGFLCLFVFDGFVVEVAASVAKDVHRSEHIAAATTTVATVKESTKNEAFALQAALTTSPEEQEVVPTQDEGDHPLYARSTTPTTAENAHKEYDTPVKHVVDKNTFDQLSFRCTAIITERDKSAKSTGGSASEKLDPSHAAIRQERTRHDRQYMAKFTVEGGVCTVVVRGRSYLNTVVGTNRGAGSSPIKPEGRDVGTQRVLDQHGVSLAACLQTFDVMQDMEDPDVVLDMLAAGICQLSTRYTDEGIEFPSLNQSEQGVIKADVLRELHLATQGNRVDASEWDTLKITMKACGGVTSVSLTRSKGDNDSIPGHNASELIVSPLTDGWSSPEEIEAALASHPGALPPPSPQAVPRSAVNLIGTLMGCNLCEVLGSLRPGTGTDGRLSLIGRVGHHPLLAAGGEGDAFSESRGRSGEGRDETRGTFRCALEVAWNKDEGGVFVRRFDLERNEKRPRFSLRAVGIRGFSIAQLPVTLEDIDAVWDQTGTEDTSGSDDISSDPGTTTASTVDVDAPHDQSASSDDQGGGVQSDDRSLRGARIGLTTNSNHADRQGIPAEEEEDVSSKRDADHDEAPLANKMVVEETRTTSEGAVPTVCERGAENDPSPEITIAERNEKGPQERQEEEGEEGNEGKGQVEEDEADEDERDGEEAEDEEDDVEGEEGGKGQEDIEGGSEEWDTTKTAAEGARESIFENNSEKDSPDTTMVETHEKSPVEEEAGRSKSEQGSNEKRGRKTEEQHAVKLAAEEATATHRIHDSGSDPSERAIDKLEEEDPGGEGEEEEGKEEDKEQEEQGEEKQEDEKEEEEEEEEKGGGGQKGKQEEEDQERGYEESEEGKPEEGDALAGGQDSIHVDGAIDTIGRAPPNATRHADIDGGERSATPEAAPKHFELSTGVIHHMNTGEATTRIPGGTPPVTRHAGNLPVSGLASLHSTDARSPTPNEELGSAADPGTQSNIPADFAGGGTCGRTSVQQQGTGADKMEAESSVDGDAIAHAVENARNVSTIPDGSLEVPTLQRSSGDLSLEDWGVGEKAPTICPDVLGKPSDTPSVGARAVEDSVESDEKLDDERRESPPERDNRSAVLPDSCGDQNDDRRAYVDPEAALVVPGRGNQDLAISPSTAASSHTSKEGTANLPAVLHLPTESQERSEDNDSHQTSSSAGNQNRQLGQSNVNNTGAFPPERAPTDLRTDPQQGEDGCIDGSAAARTDAIPSSALVFPPQFSALVVLSTAGEDAVECTVDGEISLEHDTNNIATKHKGSRTLTHGKDGEETPTAALCNAGVEGLPQSKQVWRSLSCTYKIARQGNVPPADIDLEDDDAQARLEDVLTQSYGLTMDEVLQQFRPETDLTSGEKVVQSFADSIFQLRLSQRQSGGENGGSTKIDAVREAVGEALRGPPGWDGMLVCVDASRVLGVDIISAPGGQEGANYNCGDPVRDTARIAIAPSPLSDTVSRVDCSGVRSLSALRQHLLDKRVPASAVDVLERAGFLTGRAIDVAGVLAALAEETRANYPPTTRSYLEAAKGEGQESPAVYSGRNAGQLLRLNFGNESENGWECTVAVTGMLEDVSIEIIPVVAAPSDNAVDNSAAAATAARALVSRLRACSDGDPWHCPSACSSFSTMRQPPPSSREGDAVVAAEKPGSDKGSFGRNTSLNRIGAGGVSSGQEEDILKVGSRVEARFGGKSAWFPGRVRAIHDRGAFGGGGGSDLETVAVDYDDGDTEESVPRVRVRLFGQKQPRLLNEGDEVDYKKGKIITLARVVRRSESEGHYDLRLLDGRAEKLVENCPRHAIMALHGWPPGGSKPSAKT